jgi:hypothetical protein
MRGVRGGWRPYGDTGRDGRRYAHRPGRYVDPGGELGLREWTGTEWRPDLHVDPATSGTAGQEGPPVIVSPLPGEVQRQLSSGLWGSPC